MHHHHAVALLLFSIAFAAFALFTLCTFAPKVHGATVNNPGLEEQSIASLAGLPIRRRDLEDIVFGPFSSPDSNKDLNLPVHSTSTKSDKQTALLPLAPDSFKPETIQTYPISRLLLQNGEQVPLRHPCEQHIILSDASSSPVPANSLFQAIKSSALSQIVRTLSPFKRQGSSTSCDALDTSKATPRKNMFTVDNDGVASIPIQGEIDADLLAGDYFAKRNNGPEYVEASQTGKKSSGKDDYDHETSEKHKRNLFIMQDSGINDNKNNVFQQIDFDRAQRIASSAGLAPGFLIETEYLTPGRKTVQRMAAGLRAKMSQKIGSSIPETIIDGTLSHHDAQDIPPYILQQESIITSPFDSFKSSRLTPHFELV